ncbi:unnamed protein product, partial [marine sediment metagenome]
KPRCRSPTTAWTIPCAEAGPAYDKLLRRQFGKQT